MPRSLRGRLLVIAALMLFATAAVVVFLAGRTATTVFERVLARRLELQLQRAEALLLRYYQRRGDWAGVQSLLEQMEQVSGERLVLAAPDGHILADSRGEPPDPRVDGRWPAPSLDLVSEGRIVGLLHVRPGQRPLVEELRLPSLISPTLPLGALGAALAAIALTVALSHRILRPVESLTEAARRMQAGDLTQRVDVHSSDEVGTLAQAFNAMADGLARQEEMRRNMVSDIAHELRTPLTNIVGYLEAAQDGLVPLDQDLVANLHEEAALLGRLVGDLQELALADAGQLSLQRTPVDLGELICDALTMTQPQAQARGVRLEYRVSDGLPPVDADPQRVMQVLRNLLNNALAATPSGGTVWVRARREGDVLHATVRDTGHGIPAEDLPRVFDRFYRVDRARARATGGSGLGLAIVKQWIEAHRGRVWAESVLGAGSAFHFTLPLAPAEEQLPHPLVE